MALVLRDRMDAEYKKRAVEQAPEVHSPGGEAGRAEDRRTMVEDFAKRLDTWVVTAGEELYREMLEVLNSTQDARAKADHDETKAKAEVEVQAEKLEGAKKRVADLRATLWAPKDKVRIDSSVTPEAPAVAS